MNIYKQRLTNSYQMLLFIKKYYPSDKVKYWEDIRCNRDGTPQRLWRLRKKLKMSLPKFAKSINLPAKKYEKFERIGSRVPERVVSIVAKKYGVDTRWLKAEL